MNDRASVANYIEPYPDFTEKLKKARTLMGGTTAMRRAGIKYLPQFEGETDDHYKIRKQMSFLFNGYRKTVHEMAGRVFVKEVDIDDANPLFDEYVSDIDLEGNNLTMFAKKVFEHGLQSGIEYIMVDAPLKGENETRADVLRENLRPYLSHIRAEDALGWKTERINGKQTLSQFRFMEWVEVENPDDEFSVDMVQQVRVLDLRYEQGMVESRVFRKNDDGDWIPIEQTFMEIDEIPIVPFYADRKAFMKGEPVLEDLADLNVAHWQSQSDQRNILHFTRVPILFAKGIGSNAEFRISASELVRATNKDADVKFVEHNGNTIKAGKEDLEHIELLMEVQGMALIVSRSGPQTATGELIDETKDTSQLTVIVKSQKDAFQKCFELMGHFAGVEFTGQVRFNDQIAVARISQHGLQVLLQSLLSGNISRETFWQELQRYGLLRETFDPDLEMQKLEDDEMALDDLPVVDDDDDDDDLDDE